MQLRIAMLCAVLVGLCLSFDAFAYQLYGTIKDQKGLPIPYASVYVANTTNGVASNLKGQYYLELKNGEHTIVFQSIGFKKLTKKVVIQGKNLLLDVVLEEAAVELGTIQVSAEGKDPAYAIIKKAIENRKKYLDQVERYQCSTYIKASLEKEYMKRELPNDSVKLKKKDLDTIPEVLTKEKMNFVESYGTLYFEQPNKIKEIKEAYKDLSEKEESTFRIAVSTSDGNSYESDLMNKNLFKLNIAEADFNFYKSTVDVPSLGAVPIVSPISPTALLSYDYRLEETFKEDSFWVNKIEVLPKRKDAALFKGYIYITDQWWNIKAVDLEIDPSALYLFKHFRVLHNYQLEQDSIWMLEREEFFYNTKFFQEWMLGNTILVYDDYILNPEFPKNLFKNELRRTLDDAFDKDTAYWDSIRPITLKAAELEFVRTQDSIETFHKSEEYLRTTDSSFNRISIWDFLFNGIGWHNSFKKRTFYVSGQVFSFNPFGIGGIRYFPSFNYDKEWTKAYKIELDAQLNYGIINNDIRGGVNAYYTYQPKKLGRLHGGYNNIYDVINNYESISASFTNANYIHVRDYTVGHAMEFWNGVYFDIDATYAERRPIGDIELNPISVWLFGDDDLPVDFTGYNEVILDMKLRLTPGQKYYTEPYKKVIVGSKYPVFTIHYKKALPKIMGSSSNYDFLELRIKKDFKIGTIGQSRWRLWAGSFVNNKTIRFTDYKFFRGSDQYYYSDPLRSFQLLGPSQSTPQPYLQTHYLHRFNGTLLNKIPLVKKLRMQSVVGGGILFMHENDFRHAEAYVGIEKPFRIRNQLFKVGAYYVGAAQHNGDPTAPLNFDRTTWKFGIDVFNHFTNSWTY